MIKNISQSQKMIERFIKFQKYIKINHFILLTRRISIFCLHYTFYLLFYNIFVEMKSFVPKLARKILSDPKLQREYFLKPYGLDVSNI